MAGEPDFVKILLEIFRRAQVDVLLRGARPYVSADAASLYDDECVLCLEQFCKGDQVLKLEVRARLSSRLCARWLIFNAHCERKCPTCKRDALLDCSSCCKAAWCRFPSDFAWHLSARHAFGSWAFLGRQNQVKLLM